MTEKKCINIKKKKYSQNIVVVDDYTTPAGFHGHMYQCTGCGDYSVDRYALNNCACKQHWDSIAKKTGNYW